MTTVGFLIYSGVMPLLKTYVAIFFGYLLAKRGLFPPAASRGASYVTMNLALPALIFANVVPAFTSSNVSALGPMFLLAYLYQGMGFIFGMVIREVLYVPRNFWQGIVIMTGMSNWGNLPNAIILSVTAQAPFDPSTDTTLGVSYVAIFIVSFHINFWIFGAASSLSWDYLPGVPQGVEAEKRLPWHEKPLGRLIHRHILRRDAPACDSTVRGIAVQDDTGSPDIEKGSNDTDQRIDVRAVLESSSNASSPRPSDGTIVEVSRVPSPTSLDSRRSLRTSSPSSSSEAVPNAPVIERKMHLVLFRRACAPVRALFQHPIPVTLLVALLIALVQDIKALFVHISGAAAPKWHGPDGRPPLAFIMDTATFIGDIAVPLALVLLGASFARLRIPRPLRRLPLGAMFAVAFAKMVLSPIVGVFVVQAMVRNGMIDREAKAERFAAVFLSGTPAAVNQLVAASLYAPDGEVDTLSAFLLVQYLLMFFTSATLTAIAIALLT